jgi:hypothetical protein
MRYNLESRVDRLERQRPASPYEQMTYEELQARLDDINEQLSQHCGFDTRRMEIAEHRTLLDADERGDTETVNSILEQLRCKYGPPPMKVLT